MAIPVMSSKELNEIFASAQKDTIAFQQKIQAIKNDMSKKINIIKYENEFINKKLDVLDAGLIAKEDILTFENNSYGVFNDYGYMIHPKFKKTPIDIFNLKLPNGDNYFRNEIIAKINDIENAEYANLLMADNHIEKTIVFDEFDSPNISLEYVLSNAYNLGTMRFNTIEIDPYLYGAYDLTSVEIYSLDSSNNISIEPTYVYNGYSNIGRIRILLPDKLKFTKVKLNFRVNFKTQKNSIDVYPFGLKHIHFLESDFIEDSFVITEYTSDKFVEYVMNDMILYTAQGKKEILAKDYDIEVFTNYESNTLFGKVQLSSAAGIYRIPKNTRKLYVKIPLTRKDVNGKVVECLTINGLELKLTTDEQIIL